MIDIKLMIKMLESSEITSEDLAIAKGKFEMPSNLKELKKTYKLNKNGK